MVRIENNEFADIAMSQLEIIDWVVRYKVKNRLEENLKEYNVEIDTDYKSIPTTDKISSGLCSFFNSSDEEKILIRLTEPREYSFAFPEKYIIGKTKYEQGKIKDIEKKINSIDFSDINAFKQYKILEKDYSNALEMARLLAACKNGREGKQIYVPFKENEILQDSSRPYVLVNSYDKIKVSDK